MWKFSNFPATDFTDFYVKSILAGFRKSKYALLTIFKALNFDL